MEIPTVWIERDTDPWSKVVNIAFAQDEWAHKEDHDEVLADLLRTLEKFVNQPLTNKTLDKARTYAHEELLSMVHSEFICRDLSEKWVLRRGVVRRRMIASAPIMTTLGDAGPIRVVLRGRDGVNLCALEREQLNWEEATQLHALLTEALKQRP